jgi:hypothetical protein
MAARTPGPLHCIARVDRHRCRPEAEAIVAHRHRDCNAACHGRAQSQKGSNNRYQQRQAAFRGSHCITHTVQLQTICCPQTIPGK